METAIQVFQFEGNDIRVTKGEDGEPRFVAADVCKVLELAWTKDAVDSLDDDEKGRASIPTLGGNQSMTVITEAGLYSMILRSRKPEAKTFKRVVTHEILPAIRKHGMYATPDTVEKMIADPDTAIRLLMTIREEREQRELAERQRAIAIQQKSWIGTRREATAMATASKVTRELLHLKDTIGIGKTWKSVKSIEWVGEYFAVSKVLWSVLGKKLTAISNELGLEVKQVEDSSYGSINIYHINAIDRLKARLDADPGMLGKYRKEPEAA